MHRLAAKLLIGLLLPSCLFAVPRLVGADEPGPFIEEYLRNKLAEDPSHSDSWRLLGRIHEQRGETDAAREAYEKSLDCDPFSAAALFDYGQLLQAAGEHEVARVCFKKVIEFAPKSDYAMRLRKSLWFDADETFENSSPVVATVYEEVDPEQILQAGYEIQRFDQSEELERRERTWDSDGTPSENELRFFMETGVLFNTNVTLAPISRQLNNIAASSFQGFAAPEIEWNAVRQENWQLGPLFRGYFTVNEREFNDFNLASFQPGAFVEHETESLGAIHIHRLDYVLSYDFFGQERLGMRHAVTASWTTILPNLDAVYYYVSPSYAVFDAVVAKPTLDSLDGFGMTAGVSRYFRTGWSSWPSWSTGLDFDYVNTEGDNFRYYGAKVHADLTCRITPKLDLIPQGNVGFRAYPDFRGDVNRDELVYRLSARLRYRWDDHVFTSLVVNYDRFATDFEAFDSERFETGFVTSVQF